eukprot:359607-Chlamydomonas_euryale.AAC.2
MQAHKAQQGQTAVVGHDQAAAGKGERGADNRTYGNSKRFTPGDRCQSPLPYQHSCADDKVQKRLLACLPAAFIYPSSRRPHQLKFDLLDGSISPPPSPRPPLSAPHTMPPGTSTSRSATAGRSRCPAFFTLDSHILLHT